jgi:hypothetical protein
MNLTATTDIENALKLLNKALPETEAEIDAFIAEVESGNTNIPATPAHLTPSAIAESLTQGRHQSLIAPSLKSTLG